MILAVALLAHAEDPVPAPESLPLPEATPQKPKRPPAERFGTTGFRASLPAKGATVSTRVAFVQDFDGPTIGELTLRGHYAWQSFGVAVETVATAGASELWRSAGFGNTTLDLRVMFGRGSTHAIGLRGTWFTGLDEASRTYVSWWGTVPSATVPTAGLALAYDGATERVVWNVRVGMSNSPYTFAIPDVGAIVAVAQPVAERWRVVMELEAQFSESPFHARALGRHTFGKRWTVDAGVAVPLFRFFQDPSLQLLGRLEHRW